MGMWPPQCFMKLGYRSEGKKAETYSTSLRLAMNDDNGRFLSATIDRFQMFDIHLVAEDVTSFAIIGITATNIEVVAD